MFRTCVGLACGLAAAFTLGASARQGDDAAPPQAVLAAEDARAPTQAALQVLLGAARDASDPDLQAVAVRALGRLERPDLVPDLIPLLKAVSPEVRAQAANAIGQAVSEAKGDRVDAARRALGDRLKSEADPRVLGVVAATLGRLPYTAAGDATSAESALLGASWAGSHLTTGPASQSSTFGTPMVGVTLGFGGARKDAPARALLGVAEGFEALVRQNARFYKPSDAAVERLRDLVTNPIGDSGAGDDGAESSGLDAVTADAPVRVRRLALQALATAKAAGDRVVGAAFQDPDTQVRRLAVLAAAASTSGAALADHLARGLTDDEPMVRLEALRAYGRLLRDVRGCGVLVSAVSDVNTHVKLEAIDQLAGGCADPGPAVAALEAQADAVGHVGARFWHAPAHALVSLARLAPGEAKTRLAAFEADAVWQVRMYAARAAAALGDASALRRLAADANPNVRDAAVEGLSRVAAHAADDVYLAALGRDDIQLVRSAARALDGTPAPGKATPVLLGALARLTRARRDTSRDARVAILDTVRAIGSAADAPALWTYLDDFDPRVSALAAATLTAWTGMVHAPLTARIDTGPAPSWTDAEALEGARARFIMADGGAFEIALHPSEAPANVLRFVRLARAGHYDGLTFHRVVAGFVVQGGSPGANEYSGDASFTRDELGLRSNRRGAVGVSTRGRDTGDGQIFIDLVDNPRLDHDYTVFADVVRGMGTVDGLLEGAVIERVEIVP